jgi:hypothetical protein
MDDLSSWTKHVLERPSAVLQRSVVAEGLRDVHMAARWEFAKVTFQIEPARQFAFEISCKEKVEHLNAAEFVRAALVGFLDTILVADLRPYRDIRITLTELNVHEVDSNQLAFYRAGREAGKRFLEMANKMAFEVPG